MIRARKAVVSNASVWDTQRLLPKAVRESSSTAVRRWMDRSRGTRPCDSFLHLHLGMDASGLPDDLECHHVVVGSWDRGVEAENNVVVTSIPSVFDKSLAPAGKHVVHCYAAGNEPYSHWEGLRPGSAEYERLKEERSQVLWRALERFIPDVRARTEVAMVGTPLTHERFLRRHRGSYGPAIQHGSGDSFPGPQTPILGLWVCGDSVQPGIGLPAVAASGMIAANTMSPVWKQLELMDYLGKP